MYSFLRHFFMDETFFLRCSRMIIFLVGELVRQGTIPTGVEGLGATIGPFISALSLMLAAGERNEKSDDKK